MANFQAIMRLRPEVREFIRNRKWVHRGDVVTLRRRTSECDIFSTDRRGFRHSVFGGRRHCRSRNASAVGPLSASFSGRAASTASASPATRIPCRRYLADRFGFPFANVGLPEGNSRNLFSLLTADDREGAASVPTVGRSTSAAATSPASATPSHCRSGLRSTQSQADQRW